MKYANSSSDGFAHEAKNFDNVVASLVTTGHQQPGLPYVKGYRRADKQHPGTHAEYKLEVVNGSVSTVTLAFASDTKTANRVRKDGTIVALVQSSVGDVMKNIRRRAVHHHIHEPKEPSTRKPACIRRPPVVLVH